MKNYTRTYIDACRTRVDADVAAYRRLVAAAKKAPAPAKIALGSGIDAFQGRFFNDMVLVLDEMFVHRLRTVEGKDGNALNEVRVLCDSMLHHNNVIAADSSIKLSPSKSVLKYEVGDEIRLSETGFVALSTAFFAEIERKYL